MYNDGSRTWRTPGTTTTDNDGRFSLSRLFPGDSQLRVWQGTDSSDVNVPLGWSAPTDQERNLGDLRVDTNLLAQLQRTLFVDVRFDGEMHMSDGSTQTSFLLTTSTAYDGGSRPVWNGTSFDLEFTRTYPSGSQTQTLTGVASSSGREILSLTAIDAFTNDYGSYRKELALTGLAIEAGNIHADRLWYSLAGPSVQDHVSTLTSTLTPAGGGSTVSIVSINWQSAEHPPELSLEFKTE